MPYYYIFHTMHCSYINYSPTNSLLQDPTTEIVYPSTFLIMPMPV